MAEPGLLDPGSFYVYWISENFVHRKPSIREDLFRDCLENAQRA
jgi:hypothetical protein